MQFSLQMWVSILMYKFIYTCRILQFVGHTLTPILLVAARFIQQLPVLYNRKKEMEARASSDNNTVQLTASDKIWQDSDKSKTQ